METINSKETELQSKPFWVIQAESCPSLNIRVLQRELEDRYVNFPVIPENIFFAKADELGYLVLPAKKIVLMEQKMKSLIIKQQRLSECVDRNNRGIALEKEGRITEAVELYEENIKPGCWPAMHSFDRLLVYYRRNKDYKNELRVCKRAITVFKGMDKYTKRLEKIEALLK